MKLIKSKRAEVKVVVKIALLLFVLLLLIYILTGGFDRWNRGTRNCPGTCRDVCEPFEIQYYDKCYEGGQLVNANELCCVGGSFGENQQNQE